MMIYRVLAGAESEPFAGKVSKEKYEAYGFDYDAIKNGDLPTADSFAKTIKKAVSKRKGKALAAAKKVKKEGMSAEEERTFWENFWKEFKVDVASIYEDILLIYNKGGAVESDKKKLDFAITLEYGLAKELEKKRELLNSLNKDIFSDPEKKEETIAYIEKTLKVNRAKGDVGRRHAAELTVEEQGRIRKKDLTEKKDTTPYSEEERKKDDAAYQDYLNHSRDYIEQIKDDDVRKKLEKEIEEAEKGNKGVVTYKPLDSIRKENLEKALEKLKLTRPLDEKEKGLVIQRMRREINKDIEELNDAIKDVKTDIKIFQTRTQKPGSKPSEKIIQKPKMVSPMTGDVSQQLLMQKILKRDYDKIKITQPHHMGWLYNKTYLNELLGSLEKEPKPERTQTLKPDITEDAMSDVNAFLGKFLTFIHYLKGKIHSGKDFLKDLDPDKHSFALIPENLYDAYRKFMTRMKEKYSEEEYDALKGYSFDTNVFLLNEGTLKSYKRGRSDEETVTKNKALLEKFKDDRKVLESYLNHFHKNKVENDSIYEKNWKNATDGVTELYNAFRKMKVIFNKAYKQQAFRTFLKITDPVEVRKSSYDGYRVAIEEKDQISYPNLETLYKKYVQAYENFKELVDGDTLIANAPEGTSQSDTKEFTKILHDYTKTTSKEGASSWDPRILNKWMEDFNDAILKLYNAIVACSKEPRDFLNDLMKGIIYDTPPSRAKKATGDLLRRLANIVLSGEKHEERSEYSAITMQRKHLKTRAWMDYFEKSFPIEEFLNKWFLSSGGRSDATPAFETEIHGRKIKIPSMDTLNPAALSGVIDDLKEFVKKGIARQFNPETLKKEDEISGKELKKVQDRLKEIPDQVKTIDDLCRTAFKIYDEQIEMAKKEEEEFEPTLRLELEDIQKKKEKIYKALEELHKAKKGALETLYKPDPAMKRDERLKKEGLTPEIVSEHLKEMKGFDDKVEEYNKELNALDKDKRDLLINKGKTEDPFTGVYQDISKLEEEAAGIWDLYLGNMTKLRREIERLEDAEITHQNALNKNKNFKDLEKIPDSVYQKALPQVASYLWNVLDYAWMRNKLAFDSHFNANIENYIATKNKFDEMAGYKLPSLSYKRIIEEIEKNMRFLKDKGQLKDADKDKYKETIDKLYKLMGIEPKNKKEKKEKEEKKAASAFMIFRVASAFMEEAYSLAFKEEGSELLKPGYAKSINSWINDLVDINKKANDELWTLMDPKSKDPFETRAIPPLVYVDYKVDETPHQLSEQEISKRLKENNVLYDKIKKDKTNVSKLDPEQKKEQELEWKEAVDSNVKRIFSVITHVHPLIADYLKDKIESEWRPTADQLKKLVPQGADKDKDKKEIEKWANGVEKYNAYFIKDPEDYSERDMLQIFRGMLDHFKTLKREKISDEKNWNVLTESALKEAFKGTKVVHPKIADFLKRIDSPWMPPESLTDAFYTPEQIKKRDEQRELAKKEK